MIRFKELVSKSPNPETAERTLVSLNSSIIDDLIKSGEIDNFIYCCSISPFIAKECVKDHKLIKEIFIDKGYMDSIGKGSIKSKNLTNIERLKRWHKKEHIKIAVRDLLQIADIRRILKELSILADITIEVAISLIDREIEEDILVLGAGKLGGEELNYFSDIDILYAYKNGGDHSKFTEFFEKLTSVLSSDTDSYRMYNVDLRLRPQGTAGPICLPLEAYRIYYENYGRTWEKLMLIKVRRVFGSHTLSEEFFNIINPFVYKKYLDLSYIEKIKNHRDEIIRESSKISENIKLMRGGIREIEFIVNFFQLIYGGKIEWLRVTNTLIALSRLHASGLLNSEDYSKLYTSYLFLRKLENRLQILYRTQTHNLPKNHRDLKIIANSMGFYSENCIEEFENKLKNIKESVSSIFEELFSDKKERTIVEISDPVIWESIKLLNKEHENLGYILYEESTNAIDAYSFMNNILHIIKEINFPKHSFIDLIISDKTTRTIIVKVLGTSQFVSKLIIKDRNIVKYLLERIVDMSILDLKPTKTAIRNLINSINVEDTQSLRNLRNYLFTNLMALDALYLISLKELEVMLSRSTILIVKKIYNELKKKNPQSNVDLMALGRLATREMLYFSDLDLVFIGDDSKENLTFVNELISVFSKKKLLEDDIYTIDTRLRPFGNAGNIITSVSYFKKYIKYFIKPWEVLAYSRSVILNENLSNKEIMDVATDLKNIKISKEEFVDVIKKVRESYYTNTYNIKLSEGGIIEIDLLLSFLKVKYELRSNSNRGILKELKKRKILEDKLIEELTEDYNFLRLLEKNCKLLFYPPTSELPNRGKKLSMLAKFMGIHEDTIIDKYTETKKRVCRNIEKIIKL
ncbi:MAG: hypothetical protein ACPLSJ_01010 [Thermosulfidibacteraceae bacterium]|jgi:glutamate-ammonia-ligase adenylyltransferase